jgi:hypothetical protein
VTPVNGREYRLEVLHPVPDDTMLYLPAIDAIIGSAKLNGIDPEAYLR